MKNEKPKSLVSVIMSVYNGERYVEAAIKSILEQTFQDFEFLIVDDGSVDNTREIIERFAADDFRIKFFSIKNNGLANALNFMIQRASGKYIARMDADDFSMPERLEKQFDFLERHTDIAIAASGVVSVSQNDMVVSGKIIKNNPENICQLLFRKINPIAHGTVMIRKNLLEHFSMPYRFRYGQDYDLWLRVVMSDFKIGCVEEILYIYRLGSQIQSDYSKYLLRVSQMSLLMELLNDGKLFDDNLCITQTAKLYNKFKLNKTEPSLDFRISAANKLKLKFLHSTGNKLRREVVSCIKKYSFKNIFLFYFLLSCLPQKLGFKIFNLKIMITNDKSTKQLTSEELLQWEKRLVNSGFISTFI